MRAVMNKLSRPLFVTFEGGEGAGKTTLMKHLENFLSQKGYSLTLTREPGGTSLGEAIRSWLLEKKSNSMTHMSELLLFLADRAQHLEEVIRPALKEHHIVLCDRFNDSTVAYQGIARGLGMQFVQNLCEEVCEGLVPDLTFYLDINPALGLERVRKTRSLDSIETENSLFHQKIRHGFLTLASLYPERIKVIDAEQDVEQVFQQSLALLEAKITLRNYV
jgi:dTMP kinase